MRFLRTKPELYGENRARKRIGMRFSQVTAHALQCVSSYKDGKVHFDLKREVLLTPRQGVNNNRKGNGRSEKSTGFSVRSFPICYIIGFLYINSFQK